MDGEGGSSASPEQERWQRLKTIVYEACERPATQRDTYLDAACGGDEALRREAAAYVALKAPAADFIEQSAVRRVDSDAPLPQGARIGSYRVVESLGSGGMGEVYLAERADGTFKSRVAVKVLRARGLLGSELLDRFLSERQILAEMKHPNIAHLVDGGVLEDGRPYLVMEYVEGVPIDRFCREGELTVEERLRLFLRVCDAVRHAHRLLVVHRDLKPSNVLVTGEGVPKLLDFGVAKDVGGAGKTPDTRLLLPVTPEYASPEQLTGGPVTTAVDVFALGVVLHELLTGKNPFGGNGDPLAGRSSTSPPSRPSLRLRRRGSTRRKARLSGDLDHVVLRALEPDPEKRYSSVEEMAREIDRHLRGLPLESRGGLLYRLGKLGRRHWKTLSGAAVVAVLAVGLVWEQQERREAEEERQRLERENQRISRLSDELGDYLVGIFPAAGTLRTGERSRAVEQMLDRAAELLDGDAFLEEPSLRAMLLGSVGQVYRDQGWPEKAEPRLREALALRRRHLEPDDQLIAVAYNNLAVTLRALGKYVEARDCLLEVKRILKRHYPGDHPQVAVLLNNLGGVEKELGRFEEAVSAYREALEMKRRLPDTSAGSLANSLTNLGTGLQAAGRPEEAEAAYREALTLLSGDELKHRVYRAGAEHHLGRLLRDRGDFAPARELLERALETRLELRHPAHRETLATIGELALLDQREGRLDVAEERLRRVVTLRREHLGSEHPKTGEALVRLGRLLAERGDVDGAVAVVEEAVAVLQQRLPEGHWRLGEAEQVLVDLRFQTGR